MAGQSLRDPRFFATDGVLIDPGLQADLQDFAEGDARAQHRGEVGVNFAVLPVPQDQAVVGVIDADAVGHGLDRFQQLTQDAATRPPDHAGEEGAHAQGQGHAQGDPQRDGGDAGALG